MTDRNSILWDLDEGKEFDARQELGKSPDKLWKCYCPVKSNFKKSYKVRTFLYLLLRDIIGRYFTVLPCYCLRFSMG